MLRWHEYRDIRRKKRTAHNILYGKNDDEIHFQSSPTNNVQYLCKQIWLSFKIHALDPVLCNNRLTGENGAYLLGQCRWNPNIAEGNSSCWILFFCCEKAEMNLETLEFSWNQTQKPDKNTNVGRHTWIARASTISHTRPNRWSQKWRTIMLKHVAVYICDG